MATASPASGGEAVRGEALYAYVSRGRTHEVLAVAEPEGDRVRWTVTERPAGSADPHDWIVVESLEPAASVPSLVRDLEARLAATGDYLRVPADGGPPTALAPPPPGLDLRSHAVPVPGAPDGTFLEYFHFHGARDSRVLMALPRAAVHRDGVDASKFVLASFDYPTGLPRLGKLSIQHGRLAPEMVVSQVAHEHIALPRRGFRKLYSRDDYRDALGPDWTEKASSVVRTAAEFLFRGRVREKTPAEAPVPAAPEREIVIALRSPAYRAARASLLPPGDAPDKLIAESELAIRRALKDARRTANHRDQARLSLLEAGLLVEYGMAAGRPSLIEEYSAQLVRLARSLPAS